MHSGNAYFSITMLLFLSSNLQRSVHMLIKNSDDPLFSSILSKMYNVMPRTFHGLLALNHKKPLTIHISESR